MRPCNKHTDLEMNIENQEKCFVSYRLSHFISVTTAWIEFFFDWMSVWFATCMRFLEAKLFTQFFSYSICLPLWHFHKSLIKMIRFKHIFLFSPFGYINGFIYNNNESTLHNNNLLWRWRNKIEWTSKRARKEGYSKITIQFPNLRYR